jgi:uncharacterized protein YprB with RNaseH-like and TPR domain
MDLADKLSRIAGLRAQIAAVVPVRADLAGREERNEEGVCFVRDQRFPLDHSHGARRLGELPGRPAGALARLARAPALAGTDLGRALFLDTETSSLGGGAGTYVFLVGVGWFEADAFRVEQYFLRTHGEERALLAALGRRLAAHPLLVSFAGRAFDAPRIRDRFSFHRLRSDGPWDRHLDLLNAGRRLWRGALPDHRLRTLETALLGFVREDDLPGEECPAAWFRWLHGDASLVARVFRHNLLDVVALVALAAEALEALDAPRGPAEALARARLSVDERDLAGAWTWIQAALDGGPPAGLEAEALLLGARVLRRSGAPDGAAALWRRAAAHAALGGLPHVELAKFHEHRLRDYAGALREVERAERKGRPLGGDDLTRRRRRLARRAEGPPGPAR